MEVDEALGEQPSVYHADLLDADLQSRQSLLGARRTCTERCTSLVPDSLPQTDDNTLAGRHINADLTSNSNVDVDSNLPQTVSHQHHQHYQQQQQHQFSTVQQGRQSPKTDDAFPSSPALCLPTFLSYLFFPFFFLLVV